MKVRVRVKVKVKVRVRVKVREAVRVNECGDIAWASCIV